MVRRVNEAARNLASVSGRFCCGHAQYTDLPNDNKIKPRITTVTCICNNFVFRAVTNQPSEQISVELLYPFTFLKPECLIPVVLRH